MNIILFGGPGAGKGTQALKIAQEYKIPHISTGDMLRGAAQETSPLAQKIKDTMQRGELVSDELLREIVAERLNKSDCTHGVILDGYPRTLGQAKDLEEILNKLGKKIDTVLYIAVPEEELVRRLSLRGRADDTLDTIKNRLKVYMSTTRPVLDYYQEKGLLQTVEGVGDIEAIFKKVKETLAGKKLRS